VWSSYSEQSLLKVCRRSLLIILGPFVRGSLLKNELVFISFLFLHVPSIYVYYPIWDLTTPKKAVD
jgi:hypothetical protein